MTKKWLTRSRRRFFSLVVVFVIVITVLTIWIEFARHDSSKTTAATRDTRASAVQPAERVAATGIVIASRTAGVRFCFSISDLMFNEPPPCTVGVRVVGVDFSRLAFRSKLKGVRSGTAYLAGILRDGDPAGAESRGDGEGDLQPQVGRGGRNQIIVSALVSTRAVHAALSSVSRGLIRIDPWPKRLRDLARQPGFNRIETESRSAEEQPAR